MATFCLPRGESSQQTVWDTVPVAGRAPGNPTLNRTEEVEGMVEEEVRVTESREGSAMAQSLHRSIRAVVVAVLTGDAEAEPSA